MALFFRSNKKPKPAEPEATQVQPAARQTTTGPGRLADDYHQGEALPVPLAVEKDSDSVWAMWNDALNEPTPVEAQPTELLPDLFPVAEPASAPAAAAGDTDEQYLKTVSLNLAPAPAAAPSPERIAQDSQETVPATLLMDLPDPSRRGGH